MAAQTRPRGAHHDHTGPDLALPLAGIRGPSLRRDSGGFKNAPLSICRERYRRTALPAGSSRSGEAFGRSAIWAESAAFIGPWKAAMPPGKTVPQARSW